MRVDNTGHLMPTRLRMSVVLACSALILAACGSRDPAATTSTVNPPSTTTTTALTTTTTQPETTTILAPTTTSTSLATTTTLPEFPPERTSLEHGGDAWVVVLAASDEPDDPALDQATATAEDAGYTTGVTDCDFGASEAWGPDAGDYTVSVYLQSEQDAHAALAGFEARGVTGVIAEVQTFCLD
jgi:hypothetical protein